MFTSPASPRPRPRAAEFERLGRPPPPAPPPPSVKFRMAGAAPPPPTRFAGAPRPTPRLVGVGDARRARPAPAQPPFKMRPTARVAPPPPDVRFSRGVHLEHRAAPPAYAPAPDGGGGGYARAPPPPAALERAYPSASPQHPQPSTQRQRPAAFSRSLVDDAIALKKYDRRRYFRTDSETPPTSNEASGAERRPTASDDSLPLRYRNLHSVLLDHTYALTARGDSSVNGASAPPPTNDVGPPAPDSTTPALPPPPPGPVRVVYATSVPPDALAPPPPPVPSAALPPPPDRSVVVVAPRYASPIDDDDDAASIASSIEGDARRGSDTDTAPEGEEEGKTRCVCEFTHDDGYMICCDRCGEWQHVDCMGIDRQNIPDDYMCDRCDPRSIDRKRARSLQLRKREELQGAGSTTSDSSSGLDRGPRRRPPGAIGPGRKRPLTVTTYSNTVGGVSRTLPPALGAPPPPPYSFPEAPPPPQAKKAAKRPRRIDNGRKGPKRKFPEKKKRKGGDAPSYRSKCSSFLSSHPGSQRGESYEVAVTNHYSPELRAKIARYCNNKGTDSATAAATDASTAHSCTTVPHAGGKILIATEDMKENAPIIELRGKYMLSNQHKPQPQLASRNSNNQKPGPFLFFYRLPKDATQICIDTRTYGNEARFVRRSCKPNAELQHCIVKGALHVYLVTVAAVQSNTEITIGHDTSGNSQPCACGNPKNCKQNPASAPAANKSESTSERRARTRLSSSSSTNNNASPTIVKSEDAFKSDALDAQKDRDVESDLFAIKREIENNILQMDGKIKAEKEDIDEGAPVKSEEQNSVDVKMECEEKEDATAATSLNEDACKVPALHVKDEEKASSDSPDRKSASKTSPTSKVKEEKSNKKQIAMRRSSLQSTRTTRATANSNSAANESADEKSDTQSDSKTQASKDKKKMTREERKMEAIMKAFERLEKAELRRQENRDRQTKRRESDSQPGSNNENKDADENDDDSSGGRRRAKKNCRSRTVSQNQQRNRNRLNSADSDMVTSGEESLSLLSPPIGANSLLSNAIGSSEDASGFNESLSDSLQLRQTVQRLNVGLSSACLLVEAAVGPLESTFKFPKTKKDMMNEWLNKSPDSNSFDMTNPMDYKNTSDNNNYDQKNKHIGEKFENLMKAANTLIGNFSGNLKNERSPEKCFNSSLTMRDSFSHDSNSPIKHSVDKFCSQNSLRKEECEGSLSERRLPRRFRKGLKNIDDYANVKRCLRSNADSSQDVSFRDFTHSNDKTLASGISQEARDTEVAVISQPHSAKKRWLRQAISEESDSPTAESPPNEILTPLKKRRLARESLSVETPDITKKTVDLNEKSPENLIVFPKILKKWREHSEILIRPIAKSERVETEMKENVVLPISHNSLTPESETKEHPRSNHLGAVDNECSNFSPDVVESKIEKANPVNAIEKISTDHDDAEKEEKFENLDWKNNLSLEEIIGVDTSGVNFSIDSIKSEMVSNVSSAKKRDDSSPVIPPVSNIPSPETCGKSSPIKDDMSSSNSERVVSAITSGNSSPIKYDTSISNVSSAEKSGTIEDDTPVNIAEQVTSTKTSANSTSIKYTPVGNDSSTGASSNSSPFKDDMPLCNAKQAESTKYDMPVGNVSSAETSGNCSPIKDDIPVRNAERPTSAKTSADSSPIKDDMTVDNAPSAETSATSTPVKDDMPVSNVTSAETSANSSPVKDDMDDIKQKIHTFHTENIQILQIRNKKPKEKRKKVNLNFELCVLADQTIGVKLKSEAETVSDATEAIDDKIYLKLSDFTGKRNISDEKKEIEGADSTSSSLSGKMELGDQTKTSSPIPNEADCEKTFTPPSFTNSFKEDESNANIQMPDIDVIKNAIDMTASLELGINSSNILNSNDEYKNVQEILSRVNQMDSHNSLLLSGVLKDSTHSAAAIDVPNPIQKTYSSKFNDPRLNPPPVEIPKPIRRKLSITEYRRRHSMASNSASDSNPLPESSSGAENTNTQFAEDEIDLCKTENINMFKCLNALVTDKSESTKAESTHQSDAKSNSLETDSPNISLGENASQIETGR